MIKIIQIIASVILAIAFIFIVGTAVNSINWTWLAMGVFYSWAGLVVAAIVAVISRFFYTIITGRF